MEHYSGRGINYRALDDLFDIRAQRRNEVGSGWEVGGTWVQLLQFALSKQRAEGSSASTDAKLFIKLLAQARQPAKEKSRSFSGTELNNQHLCVGTQVEYDINVQMLEIYNENLRDLLVSEEEARQQRSLELRDTQRSGCNVPDAIQVGRRRPFGGYARQNLLSKPITLAPALPGLAACCSPQMQLMTELDCLSVPCLPPAARGKLH